MDGFPVRRSFASDNNSGVSPEIMEALAGCNAGHCVGYGDDIWTKQAVKTIAGLFSRKPDVFFVYGGTGANVLSLSAATPSFGAVICAETAHINVDECGAPEKFSGAKLVCVPTLDGKITVDQLDPLLHNLGDPHHSQPRVLSISQPTELGTVYRIEELQSLSRWAKKHEIYLHMDGARIANALVALDVTPDQMIVQCGIDLVSFGATKNGIMFGEAILSFVPELSERLVFLRKQGMQLHSKMRYIGAQFEAWFSRGVWRRNAEHANAMARYLEAGVREIPGVEVVYKVETNAVFAKIPIDKISVLQDHYFFYVWKVEEGIVRWMASFDTEKDDIDSFLRCIVEVTG